MPATFGLLVLFFAFMIFAAKAGAQSQMTIEDEGKTWIVHDAPDLSIIALSKKIVIQGHAKEVFVWGGEIIVEGRVDGDVAVFGGSIVQKPEAHIGGAVIVLGGTYRPEGSSPSRTEGKETIVFGAFEEELKDLAANPTQILAPSFTPAFLAQRILSALFWFIVTLGMATIAPGAVSRAIARLKLSMLKVFGIGAFTLILVIAAVLILVSFLPDYIAVAVGLMAFTLLMLSYVFGRVVLQASTGKLIQNRLFPGAKRSESIGLLIGVVVWTALLSVPYLWTLAVGALFAGGIGLVLTARQKA
jgi:hypothetical protein